MYCLCTRPGHPNSLMGLLPKGFWPHWKAWGISSQSYFPHFRQKCIFTVASMITAYTWFFTTEKGVQCFCSYWPSSLCHSVQCSSLAQPIPNRFDHSSTIWDVIRGEEVPLYCSAEKLRWGVVDGPFEAGGKFAFHVHTFASGRHIWDLVVKWKRAFNSCLTALEVMQQTVSSRLCSAENVLRAVQRP